MDSQRAVRFTAHKMEVSRTRRKSGQPISRIPLHPASAPEDMSRAARHNATPASASRRRTTSNPRLATILLLSYLHGGHCGFVPAPPG